MSKEEYLEHRKEISLYAITISCLIMGILFQRGSLQVASDKISSTISGFFILASYYLLLKLGKDLKQRDIHGIQSIAWASFIIYLLSYSINADTPLWLEILQAVSAAMLIFFLVDGIIRLVFSLVQKIKKMGGTQEKTVESIETVVAVVTSVAAIIISIVELV